MKTKLKENKSLKFIKEKVSPLAAKAGNQRHMATLRDSFALFTSVTIVFAIAIIFITIIFGGWGSEKVSLLGQLANWSNGVHKHYDILNNGSVVNWELVGNWKTTSDIFVGFFGMITRQTMDYISFIIAIFIGYFYLMNRGNKTPILGSIVTFGAMSLSTGADGSSTSLFTAILVSMFAVTLYDRFTNMKSLQFKAAGSIPPIVMKSFNALLPILFTLGSVALLNELVIIVFHFSVFTESAQGVKTYANGLSIDDGFKVGDAIRTLIQVPFTKLASSSAGSLTILILYVGVGNLSFFFGLHPNGTIFPFLGPLLIINWIGNLQGQHLAATSDTINAFLYIGGGALLPVMSWLLFISKRKKETSKVAEVAKFGYVATVFQISEPEVFGWPMFMNFTFFIPFVVMQFFTPIIPWLFIQVIHFCPPAVIPIPWTTPIFISGLITTKFAWQSIVLTAIMFMVQWAIYLPFVMKLHRADVKAGKEAKYAKA